MNYYQSTSGKAHSGLIVIHNEERIMHRLACRVNLQGMKSPAFASWISRHIESCSRRNEIRTRGDEHPGAGADPAGDVRRRSPVLAGGRQAAKIVLCNSPTGISLKVHGVNGRVHHPDDPAQ